MQSFANPEMLAVSHGFALVVSPEENSHFRIIIPRLSNQGEQSSFGAGVSTASLLWDLAVAAPSPTAQ
jgi:hypothetical protein